MSVLSSFAKVAIKMEILLTSVHQRLCGISFLVCTYTGDNPRLLLSTFVVVVGAFVDSKIRSINRVLGERGCKRDADIIKVNTKLLLTDET